MKSKILIFLLIVTSLMGYLEWSNNHMFLLQAEGEILSKLCSNPKTVLHPFILFPIIGQIILLITLFQSKPSKMWIFISLGGLGLLLGFMFFIGIISLNFKIIISTLPFLIVAGFAIRQHKIFNKEESRF